ncbi:hypothetical protein W911_12565 [Hyphomicrobium nitrativorans NL23]|uniref:Uncharacterized protein n=1 Tax=Hyphomicrobium nitrativorans NL23 TaxID=1029756 RepID=V5SDV3_9HYPH|nr:hypothetical protein [Hyphomicrobium nitrativorans]AHB49051.1 hypothetical protein W911_12565 [Hyphomicrobium nitrativorans NL23]
MASILEFRSLPANAKPRSTADGTRGTADIVLFPGVRYERMTEDAEPAQKPRGRARRDRLELDG